MDPKQIETVVRSFEAGTISRRQVMNLAVKVPAIAAALAAAGHLQSASAAGVPFGGASLSRNQEAAQGGELIYGMERIVSDTLNQHRSTDTLSRVFAHNVLDNLVAVNPADGSVNPWLAESWVVSPDGLTYTFTLRQDVVFHDGTPFNAAAVKRSLDESTDPSSTGFAFTAMGSDSYDSTEVI